MGGGGVGHGGNRHVGVARGPRGACGGGEGAIRVMLYWGDSGGISGCSEGIWGSRRSGFKQGVPMGVWRWLEWPNIGGV